MLTDLIPTAAQLTDGTALAVAAVIVFAGLWDIDRLIWNRFRSEDIPEWKSTFCDWLRTLNFGFGRLIASELIALALFLLIVGLRDYDDRILFVGLALAGLDWHLWAKTTIPSMMKLFKD